MDALMGHQTSKLSADVDYERMKPKSASEPLLPGESVASMDVPMKLAPLQRRLSSGIKFEVSPVSSGDMLSPSEAQRRGPFSVPDEHDGTATAESACGVKREHANEPSHQVHPSETLDGDVERSKSSLATKKSKARFAIGKQDVASPTTNDDDTQFQQQASTSQGNLDAMQKKHTIMSFQSLPSLEVDYMALDEFDVDLSIGRVQSFALFGPCTRANRNDPDNARTKALRKLHSILKEHDLESVSLHDCILAFRVFLGLVRRVRSHLQGNGYDENVAIQADEQESTSAEVHASVSRRAREEHDRLSLDTVITAPAGGGGMASTSPEVVEKRPRRHSTDAVPRGGRSLHEGASMEEEASVTSLKTWLQHCRRDLTRQDWKWRGRWDDDDHSGPPSSHGPMSLRSVPRIPLEVLRAPWNGRADNPRKKAGRALTLGHVQLLHHMLRHSESIYGLPLNVASAPATSLTSLTDRNIVLRRTGLEDKDLLETQFSNEAFMPAHYVAVDRRVRAVLVCIRGTANIADSLTDMAATLDPISVVAPRVDTPVMMDAPPRVQTNVEGKGHTGVLRSARNLYKKIRATLLDAVAANPNYELLFTGHSLGGSVSAVLALITREDPALPNGRAICMGPVPCVSRGVALAANDSVVSVVNGSDIVPRLSVNSLAPYLATCRYVSTLRGWRRKLLEFGAQNVAVEWDELGELANAEERRAMADREHKQLFVPGIVLQLVRPKSVRHQDVKTLHLFAERKVDIIRVPRDDFVRIRHERGMLIMHAPHEYRKSLTGVLRSMGGAALKRTADTSGLLKSLTSVLPSTPDTEATVSGRRSLEAAAVLF